MSDDELLRLLQEAIGEHAVTAGTAISPDDLHDESLHPIVGMPACVVRPSSTSEVAAIVGVARHTGTPVVARGSGTGLSGAAIPTDGCIVIAFDQMTTILEIDLANQVAVVQPGVTLAQLDEALVGSGVRYPVQPGEHSGSLGGNVSTNAGGMRAVRDGVTRSHVLGLELVLADGEVLRTGGKVVKSSSGYDLTQLVVGSEGTLALVTEVTVKLSPRLEHSTTLVAAFVDLDGVADALPNLVVDGLVPAVLEYIDALTMAAITGAADIELSIPAEVAARAGAYLVVVLEDSSAERLEGDLESTALALDAHGAIDTYVLSGTQGPRLIEARERAFYVAKANGATDIVDIVVPRASVAPYLAEVGRIAQAHETFLTGCGHVGDGNVHMSIFEADPDRRIALLDDLFAAGLRHGGQISGEHGIGSAKRDAYLRLSNPVRLDLEARIKEAFDPEGLLNPTRGGGRSPQ
jgi:glycolate oxidase